MIRSLFFACAATTLLALSAHGQGTAIPPPVGIPGQCNPGSGCHGNGSVSCLYCPDNCGSCKAAGVIDHCYGAGVVHLSIDDGPHGTTPGVLEVLKAHNVSASFWVLGQNVAADPGLVKRMYDEGHFIGDHSYSHMHFNGAPASVVADEVARTQNAVRAATNGLWTPTHFRPPFGEYNDETRATVQAAGLTPVLWSLDAMDWTRNASTVRDTIKTYMDNFRPNQNSFILLLHAPTYDMLCLLPAIIQTIRARGYRFVSAQECFNPARAPAVSNSTNSCSRGPSSCTFGGGCSADVHCCYPGACCSQWGYCAFGADACGTGCLNGPCTACGSPNVASPAPFHPPSNPWSCTGFSASAPPTTLIPSNMPLPSTGRGSSSSSTGSNAGGGGDGASSTAGISDLRRSDASAVSAATPFILLGTIAVAQFIRGLL